MLQNFWIFFWLAVMAFFSKQPSVYRKEKILGKTEYRLLPWFAVLVFVPVIIMAATRGDIADSMAYRLTYESMPETLPGLLKYMEDVAKDGGFYFFSGLIRIVFGSDSVVYFLIIALIQGMILVMVYRKYSEEYVLSIFLFMASTDYHSWMFNGIRQFMAVVIIFAATDFLLRRKWVPLILTILLASTMHQSALLMIPVVFIVQGKPWNVKTLMFLGFAIGAVAYVDIFTDMLDEMMQETQYSNVVSEWEASKDNGTNILRVLVYSVPTVMSVIGLKYIRKANNPMINICVNMSIISMGLYLVSMATSGIFIGRLPIYASLYNYILLPWEVEHMFSRDSRKFMRLALVGCYLAFYTYQMYIWDY